MTLLSPSRALAACVLLAATGLFGCEERISFAPQDAQTTDLGPQGDAKTCSDDQILCNGVCVSDFTDPQNCGGCGQRCGAEQTCIQAVCQNACPTGQERCGDVCVNLQTSSANCGACGQACGQGLVCAMGRCDVTCGSTLQRCGQDGDAGPGRTPYFCSDPQSDSANCGACGSACPAGQTCESGTCRSFCPNTQMACGGRCVTLATDRANCGRCGNACTTSQRCTNGACVALGCPTGFLTCNGQCIDPTTDSANCGMCGNACPNPQFCLVGRCEAQCPDGRTACDGRCFDLQTDPANCGRCGTACPGGFVCTAGTCRLTCPTGATVCSERCVDTSNDRGNCGMCGNACTSTQVCTGGSCAASCATGQTLCGDRCVDLRINAANCGACGLDCGAGFVCVDRVCRAAGGTQVPNCTAPSAQCGNRCVAVQSDNQNCGTCGTACAGDRTCVNGACVALCARGQDRCGGVCTSVLSDRANCSACGMACAAGLSCVNGMCRQEATFQITSLASAMSDCTVVDVGATAGDDRGPIAASTARVFLTGDGSGSTATTISYAESGLMAPMPVTPAYDLMVPDVTAGVVYVLLVADNSSPLATFSGRVITQMAPLGDNGMLGNRIALSMPITLGTSNGLFGGPNRLVIHNGTRWFQIRTPSGVVEPVGPETSTAPAHTNCEQTTLWGGVAEFFDSRLHVAYVANTTNINRMRIDDRAVSPVAAFENLGDICNFTVNRTTRRWFFGVETASQFGAGEADRLGACNATFSAP